jgi:hypothetical protein
VKLYVQIATDFENGEGVLRCKDGVQFAVIAPGGFRILSGLDEVSRRLGYDIWITSGTDGEHSGPDDPHHQGRAYDIRCHDVPDKEQLAVTIINTLAEVNPNKFYTFIEDEGGPNEHIHCQVRHGMEIDE